MFELGTRSTASETEQKYRTPVVFWFNGVALIWYVEAGLPVAAEITNLYPLFVLVAAPPNWLSIRHAPVEVGGVQLVPARFVKLAAKPTVGYVELYAIWAVFTVRTDATAEDSFAAIRARSRFGIAIAAMIKMIATTIKSSISEKPLSFRIGPNFSPKH